MKRIEANTLQEAYHNATVEFGCSITELDIEVIQNSSSGFLGFFKKSAIIEVSKKGEKKKSKSAKKERKQRNQENKKEKSRQRDRKKSHNENSGNSSYKKEREPQQPKPKVDVSSVLAEIKDDVNRLFEKSCFTIDQVKVEKFNDDTVLLEFGGEDAALLIGKEGYRYKALSYLLYNWINIKYGLNIRLEIAEFLKNQEEMITKYLQPVIERVKANGRAQTKILDGVLVKIALEKLRAEFPEKYVGIKNGREGGKFIVINDFNRKQK